MKQRESNAKNWRKCYHAAPRTVHKKILSKWSGKLCLQRMKTTAITSNGLDPLLFRRVDLPCTLLTRHLTLHQPPFPLPQALSMAFHLRPPLRSRNSFLRSRFSFLRCRFSLLRTRKPFLRSQKPLLRCRFSLLRFGKDRLRCRFHSRLARNRSLHCGFSSLGTRISFLRRGLSLLRLADSPQLPEFQRLTNSPPIRKTKTTIL